MIAFQFAVIENMVTFHSELCMFSLAPSDVLMDYLTMLFLFSCFCSAICDRPAPLITALPSMSYENELESLVKIKCIVTGKVKKLPSVG